MGINLGSAAIADLKLGSTQVDKVYLGSIEVWSKGGGGGPTDWGTVKYYSVYSIGYAADYADGCTVNSIDAATLDAFLAQHPGAFEIMFSYDSGTGSWMFNWEVPIAPENMLATTGISVTLDAGAEWADFSVEKSITVDTTSPLISVDLTQSEYNSINASDSYSIHGVDVPKNAIKEIVIGTLATTTPSLFLEGAQNITTVDFTYAESLTSIGDYFLRNSGFNQLVAIPNTVTSIGVYFLASTSFNQPLVLPNTITAIGNNFLSQTPFNQPLAIPNSVTSIGNDFLSGCSSFNQLLTLSNTLTTIGQRFLINCNSFNQPLTLPDSLTSIGGQFLTNCNSLTATINLGTRPASVTYGSSDDGSTFCVNNASVPAYATGMTIVGTYASDWKAKYPDKNLGYSNRKLIIGS